MVVGRHLMINDPSEPGAVRGSNHFSQKLDEKIYIFNNNICRIATGTV